MKKSLYLSVIIRKQGRGGGGVEGRGGGGRGEGGGGGEERGGV